MSLRLADLLESTRGQLIKELERRAAAIESTEVPVAGRRKRLAALLDEVIDALRCGGIDLMAQLIPRLPPTTDLAHEFRERELVQQYLIEQIEEKQLEASPHEAAVVREWAGRAERKRLSEQNRMLSALLDGMHSSAVLLSPEARILYCNRTATKALHDLVGIRSSEVIGKTPAELGIPSEYVLGRSVEELLALALGHRSVELTAWGRAKEGRFDAVYWPDGKVGAIAVLMRDIQNRKLAQTRLDLLTKLSSLVGMSDYNAVAEALVQIPIPEFADWSAVNLIESNRIVRTFLAHRNPAHAHLRNAIMAAIPSWDRHPLWQEMLIGGFQLLTEVSDDLLRRLTKNEQQYRVLSQLGIRSMIVVPLVARGQITGILTCAYTTESGRRYGRQDPALAEELALHAAHAFENARLMKNLKSSEARFRIALAGAQTVVYEQDTSLRYVWYYNPVAPFTNLLGKTDEEGRPADEAALLTRAKRRVIDEGETVHRELDFALEDTGRRHYRETIEPLRDRSGKIVGVIGAATDLTEEHDTQQRLTDEIGFREQLMGILGHDLRNPVAVNTMVSDQLLRRLDLPPAARDMVLRIRRSTSRMKEMIETLLDMTHVRFLGTLPVSPVPTDLAEISEGAVDEMRVVWPDQPIELDVHGDPHGEWDPARMSQTISNLVSNAIAHGDRGAAVHVSIDGEGRDVEVKVHNQGPPIAEELKPVLFEPFRRGAVADRSPRGLGLGLYVVQEIVHAHHGTIDVESNAKDGTTFTVHLPRARVSTTHATG